MHIDKDQRDKVLSVGQWVKWIWKKSYRSDKMLKRNDNYFGEPWDSIRESVYNIKPERMSYPGYQLNSFVNVVYISKYISTILHIKVI